MQDLIFLIVMIFLLFKRRYEWFVAAGIFCIILSIPLFSFWVFFTAQRLTYFAAAFFLVATMLIIVKNRN